MLTHLPQDASKIVKDVFQKLKPEGFFAARDVDANAVIWGNENEALKKLDELFIAWHQSRGSDITFGRKLPEILRNAGFLNIIKTVSADTKGTPDEIHSHEEITLSLLNGAFGEDILKKGLAGKSTIENLKKAIKEWGEHKDSFFANIHIEVIGWKEQIT